MSSKDIGKENPEVAFDFEKLDVYKESSRAAVEIIMATDKFRGKYGWLVDQLRRAGASVPLNIAEGSGRGSRNDKARFFRIAQGSAYESVAALEIASNLGLVGSDIRLSIRWHLYRVVQMLVGLIRMLRKKG